MIPKTIHYCWFGGNGLPSHLKAYIETWRTYCPDYEIIEWNERNFDVSANQYCKEAYAAKKWAFVSDYARLKILYECGGIYMDTDVEVLKPLDELLKFDFFTGFESETIPITGIMGSKEKHDVIRKLLNEYEDRKFIKPDGSFDMTPNTIGITNTLQQNYGVILNNSRQIFGNNNLLLPSDYLCCKDFITGKVSKTSNSYTIHHFEGSWLNSGGKSRIVIQRILSRILGEENWGKLKKRIKKCIKHTPDNTAK